MAEQRQPFRFRLPWLSAPPPPPPPPQPRPTPASANETVSVQQFLFLPPVIAQTEAPKRAEQIEVASPPPSPIRPPTQFRAVFTSPLLSPRIPKEPTMDIFSPPQSPRLSVEATSPRSVSLPSSPAIQVQLLSQPQSPSDAYTNRQNQSPRLIVPLEEPKPVVSRQQSDPKAESKEDINSHVNRNDSYVKSQPVAISEDAKGEGRKERREFEKEEKPEPVQKNITELLTEGPKSHTKDLHGKLFQLNKEQTAGKKDEQKKHVRAQNSTNPKEKASSREPPLESKVDKASPQREIREDISKFVHSLTTGFSSGEIPMNIVTLIGDNRGASMQVDSGSAKREESIYIHRGYKISPDERTEITSEEMESSDQRNNAPITEEEEEEEEETKTFVNSNARGINDSIVFDSSITERNPGVHLVFDSIEHDEEKDKSETLEAEFTISKAEKHTHEPTVRRRCLRGLFMESSDSDEDGSEKPRRHGCRYSCRDKEFGEV